MTIKKEWSKHKKKQQETSLCKERQLGLVMTITRNLDITRGKKPASFGSSFFVLIETAIIVNLTAQKKYFLR